MKLLKLSALAVLVSVFVLLFHVYSAGAVVLPKGTEFKAELTSSLIWKNSPDGTKFKMQLTGKPVVINGALLVPRDSVFEGTVTKRVRTPSGRYTLILMIEKLRLPNGHKYPFSASLAMSSGGKQHSNESLKRVNHDNGLPVQNLTVANKRGEFIVLTRNKNSLDLQAGTVFILNSGKNVDIAPSVGKAVKPDLTTEAQVTVIQFRNGKIMNCRFLDFSRNTESFLVLHEGAKKEYPRQKIKFINFSDNRVNITNDLPKLRPRFDTIILNNGKVIHGNIIDFAVKNMMFDVKIQKTKTNVHFNKISRIYLK